MQQAPANRVSFSPLLISSLVLLTTPLLLPPSFPLLLLFILPAELRGCRRQNHHHGADDLPEAAELCGAAELHVYLPSVGGVVRRQG